MFKTISGWLAVPQKEYETLFVRSYFMGFEGTESDFYCILKKLADDRNDFQGTSDNFKKKMRRKMKIKCFYVSLVDFINTYYEICKFYQEQRPITI